MKTLLHSKVITPALPVQIRYPLTKRMTQAAGLLKGRKQINALRYQRQMRQTWERRYKKLLRS